MGEQMVCNGCSGSGAIGRHVDENGELVRDCASCNGTGKVWPSVEGEQVAEFDGLDPSDFDNPDLNAMIYEVAIECESGRVRIIVQPLPSPSERGESEKS